MTTVNMPNGDPVDFPDDMPKEQIKAFILKKFPDAAPKPQQAVGSNLLQGAANVVNKIGEAAQPLIQKAADASGLTAYQKATRPAAEAVAGGIESANKVLSAGVPDSYKEAVNTVRYGLMNPDQMSNPEKARNIKAAWDLIQAAGGVYAGVKGGLLAAKGGLAATELTAKGAKGVVGRAAEAVAPEYSKKMAEVKRRESTPQGILLGEDRTKLYKQADDLGATYDTKLNDSFMAKLKESLPKPRGEGGTELSAAQKIQHDAINEYIQLHEKKPLRTLADIRGLEKELDGKIAANINPVTHAVDATGQTYLDIRSHLHDLYTDPDKKLIQGSPEGVNALLKANSTYKQEIKHKQLDEVINIANGDVAAERAAYRSLYKRAVKTPFWTEPELEALRRLYKKDGLIKKAVKSTIAHNTMGLSKLAESGEIDTSRLRELIDRSK